jgi:hypothetical protein
VVSDAHLADLARLVEPVETPLPVIVVVSGGAGALQPAVHWARDLELSGLEIALRDSATGETAHNARRITTAVDQLVASGDLDDEVPVSVELPRLYGAPPTPDWLAALDEIAAMDHRVKLRTGGAAAGLHNALRHHDESTGFEHHGVLNVLLATRASLDGAAPADVTAVLQETDAAALTGRTDEAGLVGARRWFRSFGSCSILEPLQDLTELGLVTT